MSVAYGCVWITLVLPNLCAVIARVGSRNYGLRPNHNPRVFLDRLEGLAGRAHAAQLNGFETTPGFAAGVIIAQLSGNVPWVVIEALAVSFVLSRLLFILFYLADLAVLRSLAWLGGFILITALFSLSILP
ncbi:MAPEG family protein [Pseudomonas syringae]|nr:MAPEG family protein [Pseudomonas syringae]MBD8792208.1 MAPEG family protein [Pseudomonas syringae]MBD8804143.1 MAPEG family protein [Pseudomonas syringae]MBD8814339.1 MAPEG family protein [Pseudomonas syringae]